MDYRSYGCPRYEVFKGHYMLMAHHRLFAVESIVSSLYNWYFCYLCGFSLLDQAVCVLSTPENVIHSSSTHLT